MEKNPAERYATAQELADDLQRFLEDEPIRAKPPTLLSAATEVRPKAQAGGVVGRGRSVVALLALTAVALAVSMAHIREALQDKTQALERDDALQRQDPALDVRRKPRTCSGSPSQSASWPPATSAAPRSCSTSAHSTARLGVAFPQAAALRQPASHAARGHGRPRGLQPGRPAARHRLHGWDGHNSGFADRPDRARLGATDGPSWRAPSVRGMVYSPDGRYLAVARHDGKIRVWDPTSGQLLHTLEGHKGPAWQVAFSPDSRTMASGGSDRTVRLWDVTSGQALQVFSAHPAAVKGVAFRPDGRSVVAACDDGTVKVWDREHGRETFSFHGELLAYPGSAWFSPDARRLAWSCLDGFVKVWDTTTGQLEINQQSNTHQCRAVAFQPGRQADRRGRLRRHHSGPGRCKRPRDAHHLCPQQPRRRRISVPMATGSPPPATITLFAFGTLRL